LAALRNFILSHTLGATVCSMRQKPSEA
jgi:hypothetical protein